MQKVYQFFGNTKHLVLLAILLGLFALWSYKGVVETGIHVDLARDLHFLSEIWIHRIVWLGPMTSANFPASPIYYYLLFPGLLLSGGNALSLVFSQTFFALLALGLYSYFQIKKSLSATLLTILTIGISSWWITASSNPWNGYMYVSWVFLGLTSLWFKSPLFISALLFGISISINPVAILGLPVLFYEWLSNQQRLRRLFYILLGLLLPWTPIIIFEIITKGFLMRHWLEYPSSAGIVFDPKLGNLNPLLNTLSLSSALAIILLIVSFLIATKRARYWIVFACLPLIFVLSVSPLRQYYLLGLVAALTFTLVTVLSSHTLGKIILTLFILSYIQTITLPPLSSAGRSIPKLDSIVRTFIQKSNLDKTKKYAVVSVRDLQNSTPQADDYRFFLRTKGIYALSIDQYPQADILLLFIEVPNFKWVDFDDWHIQRFGNKKFLSEQTIGGIKIIMYGRN